MLYRIPLYYTCFQCVGSSCEDTCCRGWQIGIDEESFRYYQTVPGEFGKRLRDHMIPSAFSGGGAVFALNGRACSFLDSDGLCDIYKELGKEKLCRTCRTYPRHMEDYGELREMMLSLSCPEAARLILGDDTEGAFRLAKKRKPRSASEREKDPDKEVLSCMLEARQTITALIRNTDGRLCEKMAMALSYARDLQYHFRKIQSLKISEERKAKRRKQQFKQISKRYLEKSAAADFKRKLKSFQNREKERRIRLSAWMRCLQELEPVLGQWDRKQGKICTSLYHRMSEEGYQKLGEQFALAAEGFSLEWENLFLYFIYTYFLGACYDGDLYSKVKFAVLNVMTIWEWCMFRYQKTGIFDRDELVAASYRYAREVENSDENLEMLEAEFRKNPLFSLKSFLVVLAGTVDRMI